MIARLPFTPVDELSCYFDDPGEPNNVHLEAEVAGHLDPGRLRAAVLDTLADHPLARLRRMAWRGRDRRFWWEIPDWPDIAPVELVSWTAPAELAGYRDRLLAAAPDLRFAPPLRMCHAVGPDRDVVLLNAHHAAFDGLSCLRLLASIARHYTGDPDGEPIRPGATRKPAATGPPATGLPGVWRHLGRPARIAAEHGSAGSSAGPWDDSVAGYGFHLMALPCRPGRVVRSATVNDVLLAALTLAVARWNSAHAVRAGAVRITMPIDARRPGQSLGNLSRLAVIGVDRTVLAVPGRLLTAVSRQTAAAKRTPGPQLDTMTRMCATRWLPIAVKTRLARTARRAGARLWSDTSLLSNLGVVAAPTDFGAAAPISALWFSTPAPMPRGLSVGAATVHDRLHLCFRYRRALFDAPAAARFAGFFRDALARLDDPRLVVRSGMS